MRVRAAVTATLVGGTVVTALAIALPGVRFAYRVPTLHVVFETTEGLIALLAAFLAFGRYRRTRSTATYVLSQALALFAATNVVLSAVPRAAFGGVGHEVSSWGALVVRLTGAAVLAASAFASNRPPRGRLHGVTLMTTTAVAVGATVIAVAVLADQLPSGLDPERVSTAVANLRGQPVVVAVQVVSAALFAVAALGYGRRAARGGDELDFWICLAALVSAFARVNYALFPSLYSGWVYTGDFLRLGFYALLLIGAGIEITRYWSVVAANAALEERRRVARDLHDGLAQELAFISTQARRLARGRTVDADVIANTAERALDEARRAIAALTRPTREPLEVALAHAVRDVAGRAGAEVDCDVLALGPVDPTVREELVRVVREAVTNATRHGEAGRVSLGIVDGDPIVIRVIDDGRGFDSSQPTPANRFGLISMRERMEALGGTLSVRSRPGAGTTVELTLTRAAVASA